MERCPGEERRGWDNIVLQHVKNAFDDPIGSSKAFCLYNIIMNLPPLQ
ncbi:hypothetical protein ALCH109712_00465 [Alkalicoccus chagannorensis]